MAKSWLALLSRLSLVRLLQKGNRSMSILDSVGAKGKPPLIGDYLAEDEQFQTEYPGLFDFLSQVVLNGKERLPGKLLIYYEAGCAALCVTDAQTESVAWHIQKTIAEALEGLEQRLQHREVDWRKSKPKK
jgi:hypothetical protein